MDESVPIFPTAYLPSVLYMAHLAAYPSVSIEQKETFPKQTFRNRSTIATGNGVQTLIVPVIRPQGNHTRTEEMAISYGMRWHIQHWRAIVTAYNTSPFFLYYQDELEEILLSQHESLIELNDNLLHYLLKKLKIGCNIHYTDNYHPASSTANDYRYTLVTKKPMLSYPMTPYSQVFDTRYGFISNLSSIDLLFNLGPEAESYIKATADDLKTRGFITI